MQKLIFILVLLAGVAFAQRPYSNPVNYVPFLTGSDTCGAITGVDTVYWQGGHSALNPPAAWNTLTTYVTAANKTGEQTVIYQLAGETGWGWFNQIRVRIKSTATTITSGWMPIGDRLGALTLFVQPDTVGTPQDTTLYKVRLAGQ